MATVFFASRARQRHERRDWVRQLISLLVAIVIAAVLVGKEAEAQTMAGSAPSSGVSWSVGPGSTPATAAVSGNSMAVMASLAVTATLFGVTQVWPVGRALSVGANVMGAAGRAAMQAAMSRGALSGAALAAAMALGGDTMYDPKTNSFVTKNPYTGRQPYPQSGGFWDLGGSFRTGSALETCKAYETQLNTSTTFSYTYSGFRTVSTDTGYCQYNRVSKGSGQADLFEALAARHAGCVSGDTYNAATGMCVPPGWTDPGTSPSTNAQIEAAFAASPASWPKVFDAAGCSDKVNSYIDIAALRTNTDPCAVILVGSTGGAATAPTSNNPYPWPVQSWSIATSDGKREDHSLAMTTTIAGNSGADARTNPVSVQTTAVDTKTSTDSAGNRTTTTTTTTAPAETKPDDTDKDGAGAFSGGDATLYTKKNKTFGDVLTAFQASLSNAPWMVAARGFFTVTIGSGSCPHWSVAASRWLPAMDASPYVCSATMMALYQVGGAVVLAVAAWAAFRIAFL